MMIGWYMFHPSDEYEAKVETPTFVSLPGKSININMILIKR
jgi:hypothetical protein